MKIPELTFKSSTFQEWSVWHCSRTRTEQKLRVFGNLYELSIATTFKCMIDGLITLNGIWTSLVAAAISGKLPMAEATF